MNVSQNDAVPEIPPTIKGNRSYRIGDSLPNNYNLDIKNGADQIVFTDEQGEPVTDCARILAQSPLPPCGFTVQLTEGDNLHFSLSGTVSNGMQPGQYVFYIRAHNVNGWGNICKCTYLIII